jgi:hypothetical protein
MNRKSNEEFIQEVFNIFKGDYIVRDKYSDFKTRIRVTHVSCNRDFMAIPASMLRGSGCTICANEHRSKKQLMTQEEFEKRVEAEGDGEYTVTGIYKDAKTPVTIKHDICGNEYDVRPINFFGTREGHKANRCSLCSGKRKKTSLSFSAEVAELVGDDYSILGEYKSTNSKIRMVHRSCGKEFEMRPNNFINLAQRCPHCDNSGFSRQEKELADFVRRNYSGEIIENWRPDGGRKSLEADVYLPGISLAIEYNGLYWHSEAKKSKNYHIEKTEKMASLGVRLVQVMEDEWAGKRRIVESKLLSLIGAGNVDRVSARKCVFSEISREEKNSFLKANHIQGTDSSEMAYSLTYAGETVAVMTFSRGRKALGFRGAGDVYELVRFATSRGVTGGFSKLLKHSVEAAGIKRLRTYADLRWTSEGSNLYTKAGFKLTGKSRPGYYYFKKNGTDKSRKHRYNFRKQALKSMFPEIYSEKKSEAEIMREAGYLRIYDCGNLVYEKEF